jgi:hypothetical protein
MDPQGPVTRYTYEIVAIDEGELARCIELPVEAIGDTRDAAVTALYRALAEKLNGEEAIAPTAAQPAQFELVPRGRESVEPFGPGDVRRGRRSLAGWSS